MKDYAFDDWWNGDELVDDLNVVEDTPLYWAMQGWIAGRAVEKEENAKLCNSLARWHGQLVTAAFDHAADSIRAKGVLIEQPDINEKDEQLRTRSTYHGNNP
jgi:hypothetical protein